ncbi:MAG TPA: hypothetical protein VGV14_11015, partial [Rhodanobacter sp.]|nr:hypothetical protein [Rhodanobacter sp.]
ELLDLQWRQFKHDERYHRDILSLSVADRIRHMTLHFSKYAGLLTDVCGADDPIVERIIVDCFIIVLASANTLNANLQRILCIDGLSLNEFGRQSALAMERPAADHGVFWFLNQLVRHTGRMAKACESLDHLENVAFREMLVINVTQISRIVIAEAVSRGHDLEQLMLDRLDQVERKNLFWDKFVAEDHSR